MARYLSSTVGGLVLKMRSWEGGGRVRVGERELLITRTDTYLIWSPQNVSVIMQVSTPVFPFPDFSCIESLNPSNSASSSKYETGAGMLLTLLGVGGG